MSRAKDLPRNIPHDTIRDFDVGRTSCRCGQLSLEYVREKKNKKKTLK